MKTLSTHSASCETFKQIRASLPAHRRASARHNPASRRCQGPCAWV